MKYTKNFYQIK